MKNLLITVFVIFLFCVSDVFGQKFHTPAEIILLMSDTNAQYNIQPWLENDRKVCEDHSENLNSNNLYRYRGSEGWVIKEYLIGKRTKELMNLAEEYFIGLNFDSAKLYYELVLKEEPGYYQAKTYLAQMCLLTEDSERGKKLLEEVIRSNYIDYMAHWFLAEVYCYCDKNHDAAIKEICIASVLNRNNPRLLEAMKKIFGASGEEFNDWCFVPQYEITRFSPTGVNLKFELDWIMYAMTKAVWANEPDYKRIFGVDDDPGSYYEESESILNLYISHTELEKKGKKDFMSNVVFRKLREAADSKMLEEYIYYETVLRKYPSLAYIFTEDFIKDIASYLMEIRFK